MKNIIAKLKQQNKEQAATLKQLKKDFKQAQREKKETWKLRGAVSSAKYNMRLAYLTYAFIRGKDLAKTDKTWEEFTSVDTLESIKAQYVSAAQAEEVAHGTEA